MLIQLDEQIAVDTPLGPGYAILVEAGEDDQWWTVAISESRALVTFRQSKIRISRSYTHSRDLDDGAMRKITGL